MSVLLCSSAFLAGFAGSAHCLGMCGGITTTLGALAPAGLSSGRWTALYNLGRVGSYAFFGTLAGGLGASGAAVLGPSPYLRIATAIAIIFMGLNLTLRDSPGNRWLRAPERLGARVWRCVHPQLARRLPRRPIPRALLTGALWGWLPCGLVYSALVGAAAAGSSGGGAATMAAFGLGTVPALAGLSGLTRRLPRLGGPHSRVLGLIVVGCGIWTAWLPVSALSTRGSRCDHGAASFPLGVP